MKPKQTAEQLIKTYGLITLGCICYAVGFDWCYIPNQLSFGGVTGIAQIIHTFLPWAPIGLTVIALNAPLFLAGLRLLGWRVLVSSLYAMAFSSVVLDALNWAFVFQPMDPILACLFGGVLMGLSLGLIFMAGGTTGGTDLLARLLKLKLAWLPMGKLMMAVDLIVIVATAITFRSLYTALYGLVALTVSSEVIDRVLYGTDSAKVAYIISDRSEEILDGIIHDLDRGVTILRGEGGYARTDKNVLLCAFRQRQIVRLKQLVKEIDPDAFLIVCPAFEVLGEGFRANNPDDL